MQDICNQPTTTTYHQQEHVLGGGTAADGACPM